MKSCSWLWEFKDWEELKKFLVQLPNCIISWGLESDREPLTAHRERERQRQVWPDPTAESNTPGCFLLYITHGQLYKTHWIHNKTQIWLQSVHSPCIASKNHKLDLSAMNTLVLKTMGNLSTNSMFALEFRTSFQGPLNDTGLFKMWSSKF